MCYVQVVQVMLMKNTSKRQRFSRHFCRKFNGDGEWGGGFTGLQISDNKGLFRLYKKFAMENVPCIDWTASLPISLDVWGEPFQKWV